MYAYSLYAYVLCPLKNLYSREVVSEVFRGSLTCMVHARVSRMEQEGPI